MAGFFLTYLFSYVKNLEPPLKMRRRKSQWKIVPALKFRIKVPTLKRPPNGLLSLQIALEWEILQKLHSSTYFIDWP